MFFITININSFHLAWNCKWFITDLIVITLPRVIFDWNNKVFLHFRNTNTILLLSSNKASLLRIIHSLNIPDNISLLSNLLLTPFLKLCLLSLQILSSIYNLLLYKLAPLFSHLYSHTTCILVSVCVNSLI